MNSLKSIEIDMACPHCGESMQLSKYYHGYIGEYTYSMSCSGACYIDRDLDEDDTYEELSYLRYATIIEGVLL